MKQESTKKQRAQRPSGQSTVSGKVQKKTPKTSVDELSASEMERILLDARQTVKPIVKREEKNEFVSEDILNFKLGRD